ncbi:MAG: hypothetical protein JNK82_45440 [Myxococcaceae bacterium]|nr:hypothetical protein [Myxococcaceae bacterium]
MSRVDAKFVAQYKKAYADGKISDTEAKQLAKSADGNKGREAHLRDHLRQDKFEGAAGRQAVEKAVGGDARRASGYVGQQVGKLTTGQDVTVTRELGDPKGYTNANDAYAAAQSTNRDAAVIFGTDKRWHAVEVDAHGGSLANAYPSLVDAQALVSVFVSAPTASKVVPTSSNTFAVDVNPPAKDQKAAAMAVFGKESVPEGFELKRLGNKWEVHIPTKSAASWPNHVKWDRYQAEVKPSVQQQLYANAEAKFNVPKPGIAPKELASPDAAEIEKTKQVKVTGWSSGTTLAETMAGTKSIDVGVYDITTAKPMTQREANEFFYGQKNTPKANGLEPMPKGSKGPWSQWRIMVPHESHTPNGIIDGTEKRGPSLPMRLHLLNSASRETRQVPEWIGAKTADAIKNKQLPPKGVEVSHPKPGISTWKEGNGVFWFNDKTGQVQGFERKPGNGVGTKMWNNWNEHYIMKQGLAPDVAAEKTVKDMADTNKQMLMAFAQAMAAGRAPERGLFELGVKAVDVTGKWGLHDQPTGVDDVWQKAREMEAKRAQK